MVERPNEGTLRYLSQEYENEIYKKPLQLTENLEWIYCYHRTYAEYASGV